LQSLEPTRLHYYDAHLLSQDPLSDLVRLFQLRATVPRQRVDRIFDAGQLRCLLRLGLLAEGEGELSSRVDLFCTDGLLLATDHRYMVRVGDALDEDPVMYIGGDSHGLVQTAPRQVCDRLLDLCCGSGVQGLVASRYAGSVLAVDLNPRAVRFSRFNAQLNGIENYEARCGSLYEVAGEGSFDCILANPPFVPSPDGSLRFRDGGASGEDVLRAIVEGAPKRLRPGGRLCVVTDLVDVPSYPSKLRSWLGDLDARCLVLDTADRDELLFSVPHCHAPFSQPFEVYNAELDRWIRNFRGAGLGGVNFGYILAQRCEERSGCDVTRRSIHNPTRPVWDQVEDWFEQRRRWEEGRAEGLLLELHPQTRLVSEAGLDGDSPVHELRFPGNPFFTTYTLSPSIVDELRRLHRKRPSLAQVRAETDEGWIEELHRFGILRLTARRRDHRRRPVATERNGARAEVLQSATKTTPTCLSNYLG